MRESSHYYHPSLTAGLLLLTLCFFCRAVATESLVTNQNQAKYNLDKFLYILEDSDGNWTLEDVTSHPIASKFKKNNSIAPTFGYTSSAIWARFELENPLNEQQTFNLQIDFPLLEYIEFYTLNDSGHSLRHAGIAYPFSHRNNVYRTHVFDIRVEPKATKTFYLRISGEETIQLPLFLWKPEALQAHVQNEQYGLGLYYGIIIVMCFYNFFLFVFVRDISYLYYVVYISFLGLFAFSQNGLAFQYLWPDSIYLAKWFNPAGCGAVLISVILFSRHFLHTKAHAPTADKLLKAQAIMVSLIYLCIAAGSFHLSAFVAGALSLAVIATLISASITSLKQGFKPALYFIIAFASVILGALLYVLKTFGVLPTHFVTNYGIQIGSVLEIVLLSLGLASRINTLKEEKLQAEQEALQAAISANRQKDDFMSTITHELLTPINGIQLSLALLEKSIPNEHGKEYLATANDSTRHLLILVESMFAFSEARSGTMNVVRVKTNLYSLICDAIEQFEVLLDKNRVQLSLNWNPETPVWILCDKSKLSMVVSQLIKNACTYTHVGEIICACNISKGSQGKDYLTFSISDTGIGISPEMQGMIFEGFTQADSSANRKYGGMGIGLSIARDVLNLMGGTLELKSEFSKGSVFTLKVPIEISTEEQLTGIETVKTNEKIEPRNKNCEILVVEDNPVNMILLCKTLEKNNYTHISAHHGEEALDQLQKNPNISAILMDCQMPVMDGFEATKKIRAMEQFQTLPIIAVTANVSDTDRRKCLDVGMSDYLAKPVKMEALTATLQKWLQ